ncbi:9325_t:CDS:1, partial [Cetraspora pellucida]
RNDPNDGEINKFGLINCSQLRFRVRAALFTFCLRDQQINICKQTFLEPSK